VDRESIRAPDQLAQHYAVVEELLRKRLEQDPALDYLGARPDRFVRPLTAREIADRFEPARIVAGFATQERALDTAKLARALRRAIARSPRIRFLASHRVRSLREEPDGFRVEGDGPRGAFCLRGRQLVNATWERRLALDQQLGLAPSANVLHRLKYRVIARLPAELRGAPSVTMVLGRYGDVVIRADGTVYLSWYPAGLRGWSHGLEPPADWESACRGEAPPALAREIAEATLAGIRAWLPAVAGCQVLTVDAGAIVARGRSDVDDLASGLHDRTRIGVTSRGGHHSVDTGKLTTAPLFALEVADRVEALRLASASAA
jgi:hypothetical protein